MPAILIPRPRVRSVSFYRWLCEQTARHDPVGDFARDVAADVAFPKDAIFANDCDWFFTEWRRSDVVWWAFLDAFREYRRSEPGRAHYRRHTRGLYSVRQYRPSSPRSGRSGVSVGVRTYVLERDGFRCRRCGNGPDQERLEVDHIVPVCQGGTNAPDNLQTLCDPCNAGKAGRSPHAHDLRPFR